MSMSFTVSRMRRSEPAISSRSTPPCALSASATCRATSRAAGSSARARPALCCAIAFRRFSQVFFWMPATPMIWPLWHAASSRSIVSMPATSQSARARGTLRSPVIATWCWDLLEPYLRRNLTNRGVERPTRKHVLEEFARVWPDVTATLGVQEPYAGTIRFKWLVRLPSADAEPFLDDPEGWIAARYGGGKFKLNLHHGMHFVNTKNFKPAGEPRWAEVPALDLDA